MSKRPHDYGSSGPRKPTTIDLNAETVRVEEAVEAAKETVEAPATDAAPETAAFETTTPETAVTEAVTETGLTGTGAMATPTPETTAAESGAGDATPSEVPDHMDGRATASDTPLESASEPPAGEPVATAEAPAADPSPEPVAEPKMSDPELRTAESSAASVTPIAAAPPAASKSGAGAVFGGALGGGILGTAAAYLVATFGFWPGAGPAPANPATVSQIAALEQQVKALAAKPAPAAPTAPTAEFDKLAQGLKALEGKVAGLPAPMDPSAAVAAVSGKIDALDAAVKAAVERADAATRDLEALRKAITEAPATGGGDAAPAAVTALNQAVADLAAKLEATRQELSGSGGAVIEGLKADLEAAKAAAATEAAAAKAAAEAALKEARDRAGTVDQALKDLAGKAGQAATDQIEALKTDLGNLKGQLETALSGPVADVSKKVEGLANNNANAVAARDQATLAVALGAVKSALDAGRPFATELKAAKAIAGEGVDLAALEAVAATGAKPVGALLEAFPGVARQVLAVVDGAGADAGLMDNLLARAQNLVRVRPVGEATGTDPASRLARVEARLKAGDAGAALGEWLELPEGGRAAGGDFGAQLAARAAADAAIAKVTAELLATLSKPTQ